jgi:hypothetical protein
MFQIVRTELDGNGHVVGRQPLQPPYDLWEDAMALAEFGASRCEGDYGYDEEHQCWWARDKGRNYALRSSRWRRRIKWGFHCRLNSKRDPPAPPGWQ